MVSQTTFLRIQGLTMFYIDLDTSENTTPTITSEINESCEAMEDNVTHSGRPLIKKRTEKTFNLPKKKIPEVLYKNSNPSKPLTIFPSNNQDVGADEEAACDLQSPINVIQDSQTIVGQVAQEGDPLNDKSHEHMNDKCQEMLTNRMYVLHELIATEESYVRDLALIFDGYVREMKDEKSDIALPDDLKGDKRRMIFGNLAAIYEWHRDTFLRLLERCKDCPTDLGPLIQRCQPKLRMYVIYCQNKPVSEHIVAKHLAYFEKIRLKLKQDLDITALLIKPVQRIMQYGLLLETYLKHTERAGLLDEALNIQEAINVIKDVPKEANDMMVVGRLQNFENIITEQGKLLHHGSLLCEQVDSKGATDKLQEVQVFLFEKIIILSEIHGKKTQFTDPLYIYKSHLQVNKMTVNKLPSSRISLRSIGPDQKELSFVLMGKTKEDYREWADKLFTIRRKQNDFLQGLQNPITFQHESLF